MKNRKIGIIVSICLLIIFCIFIDYDYAKRKGQKPFFTIKVRNNVKNQYNEYLGFFYRTYECYAEENNFIFSGLKVKKISCPIAIKFNKDGYFKNANNIMISKDQYEVIRNLYSNYINEFKTNEELENAYFLAYEYQSKSYVVENGSAFISDDVTYSKVHFNVYKDGKWQIDESKDYCIGLGQKNKINIYNYENGRCTTMVDLTPTEKFCKLLKKDKSGLKDIIDGCK